jgi:AMP-polyphosphate phosphotransferase
VADESAVWYCDPLKTWKLTAEDRRNRDKRPQYEAAVAEMLDRTDHPAAPWVLAEAGDKRWARVQVAGSAVAAIEAGLKCLSKGRAVVE